MTVAITELQQGQSQPLTRPPLHVLVLPYPAKGHSLPLLHFARQLHAMGVTVTFANTFSHLAAEHFHGLEGLGASTVRVVPLGAPPAEGPGPTSLPFVEHVNSLVDDAVALVAGLEHPSCIVSDMFLGWTQVVANKFNIPRYVLFASPASGLATMLHMPELIRQGRLPIDPEKREELVHDIPGVPPTRLADLPSPMQNATAYVYPFYARNCVEMHEAAGVLINSFYELEPRYIDTLRRTVYGNANGKEGHLLSILPVGPMLPKAYFASGSPAVSGPVTEDPVTPAVSEPETRGPILQWLDTQLESSVLYVSFGSVAVLPAAQILELAKGLEMSGQRFLLVLQAPRADPEADPEEGRGMFPEGFDDRVMGRGFVHIGWAPQLWVLSHRSVGAYLTHCGWNSTLEGICRGLPMLTWPIQAEQAMNARFLVDDVKAAIEVCTVTDKFNVSKERISAAIKRLMTEPEGVTVKKNMHKLRDLAFAAVDEGGSVQRNLENFLQELRAWKTSS